MKKFLLSLATLALGLSGASADTLYELTFNKDNNQKKVGGYTTTWDVKVGDNTWSIANFNNNNNGEGQASSPAWDFVRCGRKGNASVASITTGWAVQDKLNEIIINAKKNKNQANDNFGTTGSAKLYILNDLTAGSEPAATLDIDMSTLTTSDSDITITIPTEYTNKYYRITFDMPAATNNGWLQINKVTYNGTGAVTPDVAAPKFEMNKTAEGYAVSISCETEGAKIYYTADAEAAPADPTTASDLYSAPIDVWGPTYFKAIAYSGDKASVVTSYTADVPYLLENLMPLADFEDGTKFDLRAPVTAVYQNGNYLWVADAYAGTLLFGNTDTKVNSGDKIASLEGTYKIYNELPEVTDFTLGEVTAGTAAVEPMEIEFADVNQTIINRYVKLTGVKIEDTGKNNNYTLTNAAGETLTMHNNFTNAERYDVVEVPTGENFTVTGFVGKYYETFQIIPVKIEGGQVMEQAATPEINPGSGELEANTEITITTATEGATIYYTVNGDAPTAESTEYTGAITFTEAMTLKAIAVKEGMLDSEIAEATYTLAKPIEPGTQIVLCTFDFTDPAKYDIALPEASAGTDVCEKGGSVTFTENVATLKVEAAEDAQTLPRVWGKKSGDNVVYDFRAYAKSTLTFGAKGEKDKIVKVEFIQNTGATDWGANNTYVPNTFVTDTKVWNGAETDEDVKEFVMTPAAKTFFAKANVYVRLSTGVNDVEIEDANAETVYYNLQGVRVQNPSNGIYIMVKGNKSSKVVIR